MQLIIKPTYTYQLSSTYARSIFISSCNCPGIRTNQGNLSFNLLAWWYRTPSQATAIPLTGSVFNTWYRFYINMQENFFNICYWIRINIKWIRDGILTLWSVTTDGWEKNRYSVRIVYGLKMSGLANRPALFISTSFQSMVLVDDNFSSDNKSRISETHIYDSLSMASCISELILRSSCIVICQRQSVSVCWIMWLLKRDTELSKQLNSC